MSDLNHNTNNESFATKRVKSRYIVINENIFQSLNPISLKVYMALRYESDYESECSSVKKNVKWICNKVGIKKTACFESLSDLESHGLLMREANPGYQSTYWVAQDLGHFTTKISIKHNDQTEPNDAKQNQTMPSQTEIDQPPIRQTNDPIRQTNDPIRNTDTISTISSTISSHKEPIVDSEKSTSYKDDKLFMRFYSVYPNKQKPEIARKALYKHKPDDVFVDFIVNDVLARMENNWKGRHKNKIPHPATYLNSSEWEGEIVAPESPNNKIAQYRPKTKYKTMDEILGNSSHEGFL